MVPRAIRTDVLTVAENTSLAKTAILMVERRIKWFRVISNGKMVGAISRAVLVRALGCYHAKDTGI